MHTKPSGLRRNLSQCTLEGVVATPHVYITQPGNFITAALLTVLFALQPDDYGLITSLPFWCNFLQVFILPLLTRYLHPKQILVWSGGIQLTTWALLVIVMTWLPEGHSQQTTNLLIGFFVLSASMGSLVGISWMSWVQEWVPLRLRGKYFGVRNRIMQICTVTYLLLLAWVLDALQRSKLSFQLVIGAAVFLRIFSIYLLYTGTKSTPIAPREAGRPLGEQWLVLKQAHAFFWFIAFGMAWGFAANCFGAFYPVFMLKELSLSVSNVAVMQVLASVGAALSYPAWGHLCDRFGNKPVMIFCLIAWQLQNLLWCFITPDNSWLLYGMWAFGGLSGFAGLWSAGFILGLFNLQLKLIPPGAKTLAISVYLAATSLATASGPIVGGKILHYLLAHGMEPTTAYHRLFLVQPLIALSACLLLLRVAEPAASSLIHVVGAMRNVRTLSAIFGLSFLEEFVFVKKTKR